MNRRILLLLARRKNSNLISWLTTHHRYTDENGKYIDDQWSFTCRICNHQSRWMKNTLMLYNDSEEHGMQHLRDNGLLSFV